jgi:putative ABC transport system permease protein
MLELILQALFNLRKQGSRTFLTLIGIIIGVVAIVSLLSVGVGLSVSFEEQFESLGSNSVFASPGDAFSTQQSSSLKISQIDLKNIRQISNVKEVIAEYAGAGALHFDNDTKNVIVMSIEEEGFEFFLNNDFLELVEGRWIEPNESSSIMITQSISTDSFDRDLSLRKQVTINDETFKVVGIMKLKGPLAAMGGSGLVFTTINGHKRLDPDVEVAEIIIKTNTVEDAEQVKDDVTDYFEDKYGKKSITVLTSDQAIDQLGSILDLLTLVVAGIGGISLIVGGVGIMNAMITNVLERTAEIGLYKSLGASNNKILTIFILEAAFIGLIGGIVGVLIGAGLASIVGFAAQSSGLPLRAVITIEIIAGALAFSMIAGILSGLYPAYKASKLDPVEAIRKD